MDELADFVTPQRRLRKWLLGLGDRLIRLASGGRLSSSQSRPEELKHVSPVDWPMTTLGTAKLTRSDGDHGVPPVASFATPAATRASRIPIATSKPLRIACGRGGQPGIYTSTGSTRSTPPTAA